MSDGIIDLFAGPGGWSVALEEFGLRDIGIELNPLACSTRRLAGHLTVEVSVSDISPHDYPCHRGLIASPPCQAFSSAGKKHGMALLDRLRASIELGEWDDRASADPRVYLPLEVGRWVETLWPEWIVLEQVPGALSLWESFAARFEADGYSVWTGILNAADYGVPQTRRRAVLIASGHFKAERPPPTHSRDGDPRWVTLAEALAPRDSSMQWKINTGRAWNQAAGGGAQVVDGALHPAPTLTTKSGSQWNIGDGSRGKETRRLTVEDALVVQSFPAGYPVCGTLGDKHEQIGNAVPPTLAKNILKVVL
jgi:DNA (cytosine-5)-methyltransferase 1